MTSKVLLLLRAVGAELETLEGHVGADHEGARGAEVVGGVGGDARERARARGDGRVGRVHAPDGHAVAVGAHVQPELVRGTGHRGGTAGGRLGVRGRARHRRGRSRRSCRCLPGCGPRCPPGHPARGP